MKKVRAIIPNRKYRKVLNALIETYGLPSIELNLVAYLINQDSESQLHINFFNRDGTYKFIESKDDTFQNIHKIDPNNVKGLLKMFYSSGFKHGYFNKSIAIRFEKNEFDLVIIENSYIGILLKLEKSNDIEADSIVNLLQKQGISTKSDEELTILDKNSSKVLEPLIDNFNIINGTISDYLESCGISISNNNNSVQDVINNLSNDYSVLEKSFEYIIESDLFSPIGVNLKSERISDASIIIPTFNSEETLLKTLLSIQSQSVGEKYLEEKCEVIIIDDGSEKRIIKKLDTYKNKFKFRLKVVRHEKNLGRSHARNTGWMIAENDIRLFLDSDIILPVNYFIEVFTRATLIPNAIFMSFKKNVEKDNVYIQDSKIMGGLPPSKELDDLRISRKFSKTTLGLTDLEADINTEILADSNYFKKLGYGRKIGIIDLPATVISHNLCLNKRSLEEISKPFATSFKGWGMEDAFFGAQAIALGNFIIPLVTTNVYHVDHPPRSGTEEKKKKQLSLNLNMYRSLINKPIYERKSSNF